MPKTPRCGASKRNGDGEPCELPAGWGTNHKGEGRCKHHGGASPGGKPGNDNATKHGGYKTVYDDTITEEEQSLLVGEREHDDYLKEQIEWMRIRIHRVQERIADNGGLWPEAEQALSGLTRELRQLVKTRDQIQSAREQDEDKINELIGRLDAIKRRHSGDTYQPPGEAD